MELWKDGRWKQELIEGGGGGGGGEEAYYFKHTAPLLSHSMAADQKRWTE